MGVRVWGSRMVAVGIVLAASVVVVGSAAHADPGPVPTVEVSVIGGHRHLTYTDKVGGASRLRIRSIGADITLDEAYPISITSGCTYPTPSDTTLVRCPGPMHSVVAVGGDGDDVIDDLPGAASIVPDGITQLSGGPGNDRLLGSNVVDVLTGGDGDDVLAGWSGNDALVGGAGADELQGGGGVDRAEYSDRTVGVTISNDGVAFNDGQPGERDTIASDVENLIGGSGNDFIVGNDSANKLLGGAGNDELYGNGGDDLLIGGVDGSSFTRVDRALYEADLLDGGSGNDTVSYDVWLGTLGVVADLDEQPGDDGTSGEGDTIRRVENLTGTPFADILIGDAAPNILNGLGSGDFLVGQGGPDTLNGGPGNDALIGGAGLDTMNGGPDNDSCLPGPDGGSSVECEDD